MQKNVWSIILVILVAAIIAGMSFLIGRYVGLSSGFSRLEWHLAPRELPFGKYAPEAREAMVTRVVDGDTIDCMVNLGYETLRLVRVRLDGVDAPERGQPGFGQALYFCEQWAEASHQLVSLRISGKDKYGRHVGRIYRAGDEKDLSHALLDAGLVVPYPGAGDAQ